MTTRRISDSTVRRLSGYVRLLRELDREGMSVVSSRELAEGSGTTAAQVRKDFSHFGSFGTRGKGYAVRDLLGRMERILGLQRRWRVALIGVGRIGTALLGYADLSERGFDIVTAFDADPEKIDLVRSGVRVRPLSELEAEVSENRIDIAIIATPPESARSVAIRAAAAGVGAILNFAPIKLDVGGGVQVRTVDVSLELEALSFLLTTYADSGVLA